MKGDPQTFLESYVQACDVHYQGFALSLVLCFHMLTRSLTNIEHMFDVYIIILVVIDVKVLHKELSIVKDKWRKIGDAFKVKCLDQICDLVDPLLEVVVHWLKRNEKVSPSWEDVVATLRSPEINEAELADKIHRLYCEHKEERDKKAQDQAFSGTYVRNIS